jgi:hypothetical protein
MGEERPLELNGKKYISAKRAAMNFGYSTDYIGQLSRGGKIDSVRVGRDRFIEIESLSRYVEGLSKQDIITEDISSDLEERIVPIKKISEPVEPPENVSGQARVRISPIRDNSPERHVSLRRYFAGALVALVMLMVVGPMFSGDKNLASVGNNGEASAIGSVVGKIDKVYMSFLHKIDRVIVAIWNTLRTKTLALLAPILGDSSESTMVINTSETNGDSLTADLRVDQLRTIVSEQIDKELSKTIDYAEEAKRDSSGMIVAPSTGTITGDEALKKSIASKFSDKVEVSVDPGGESGLIKPIFKNPNDGTYLYVLVPSIK